jgi:hypothetical protein
LDGSFSAWCRGTAWFCCGCSSKDRLIKQLKDEARQAFLQKGQDVTVPGSGYSGMLLRRPMACNFDGMRQARIKVASNEAPAVYHSQPGTVNGEWLFDDIAKEVLRKQLWQVADYCAA